MAKKKSVSNGNNRNKCTERIQKFIDCPIYKLVIGILSVLLSIIALITSCIAFNRSRQIEPFTYELSVNNENTLSASITENSPVDYNITPLKIHIKNGTGDINEIIVAYVRDGVIDIKSNPFRSNFGCDFEKGLIAYFNYSGNKNNVDINVGFNDLNSDCKGYFFVIFKSYEGEYYYNIIHYVKERTSQYDEDSELYWTNVDTRFFRIYDIYNRYLIADLCSVINENSDSNILVDDYSAQLEQDYNLIKSKIE
mgnify:FL=1